MEKTGGEKTYQGKDRRGKNLVPDFHIKDDTLYVFIILVQAIFRKKKGIHCQICQRLIGILALQLSISGLHSFLLI